ncbi:uncharacterized protein LOC129813493 [Salvelinus fontinalis]|uniref:uncharacterized protein LOC129813493 n=1 Tax=Salvelinus fontinalis TaxID=8038 RepID=UPI0024857EDA|nr:uncharacterized protein LOC129813493 [Salvelinus fontinalis]
MDLLSGTILTTFSDCRGEEAVDQQSGHVSALEGGLVTLSCNYTITSSPSPDLFWYIQLTRDSPQYVLRRDRYSEGSNSYEFKKRFDSRLNFTSSSVPLTIQRLQLSDSAVFYCALRSTVTTSDSVTAQQHRVECCSDNVTSFSVFDDTQKEEETRISFSHHGLVTSEWYYSSPTDLTVAGMEPWLRNLLILASFCYECRGEDSVIQPPGDVIATEGEQVTLDCQFDAVNTNNLYLFWYKHEVNCFPKFMLGLFSFRSTNATGNKKRFDAHLDKDSKSVPLTIQRLQLSDSAVYYCALRPTVTTGYTAPLQKLVYPWR